MPTIKKLQCPEIHLNGSGKDQLIAALRDADTSIRDTDEALRKCTPHGRDYYTLPGPAYERAAEQHLDRLRRLEAIRTEISLLLSGIFHGRTSIEMHDSND